MLGAAGRVEDAFLRGVATLGRDNQLAAGQKLFAHFHRLIEQTAGVVAQVHDQRLRAAFLHDFHRAFEVVGGVFTKLREAHVADFIFVQRKFAAAVEVLDRVHLDHGAGEFVILGGGGGRADDADVHVGAGFAAEFFHGIADGHFFGGLAVDFHNAITGANAGFETGAVVHRRNDGDVRVLRGNHDAEAAKLAAGVFAEVVEFARLHVLGVRVEGGDHALERAVDEGFVGGLVAIDIVLVDHLQHTRELGDVGVGVVALLVGGVAEINLRPQNEVQGENRDDQTVEKGFFHKTRENCAAS